VLTEPVAPATVVVPLARATSPEPTTPLAFATSPELATPPAPPDARVAAPPLRPACRLAEQLTGRSYLSHSQVSLFRACPRKFAFTYVERAEPDFVPSSLLFGGAVHRAMESYFRGRLEGLAVSHPQLLSVYDQAFASGQDRDGRRLPVRFNQNESAGSLRALAERMLQAFTDSPLARPNGHILAVEETLRVTLDPALPDLLAKVDLVTQTSSHLHVIDFKTSRCRWNAQKAEASADQLTLYGRMLQPLGQSLGLPVALHFAVVTKAKSPAVQVLAVPAEAQPVEALTDSIGQVWQAMQGGQFYASPSPQHCTTCPFRSRCPAFAGR
jgi:putative RecB family exonuclease